MLNPVTPLAVALRFLGLREARGQVDNPAILAMLRLDAPWPGHDEVPWCSAFVNYCAWILDLPRSKSLAARSWLRVGQPIEIADAVPGFDVVVLKRSGDDRGPEVLNAPGHVGFYDGPDYRDHHIRVIGGNQGNAVSIAAFPVEQILGVRRLA